MQKRVSSELEQKPRRLFCVWDTERRLTSHIEQGIFVWCLTVLSLYFLTYFLFCSSMSKPYILILKFMERSMVKCCKNFILNIIINFYIFLKKEENWISMSSFRYLYAVDAQASSSSARIRHAAVCWWKVLAYGWQRQVQFYLFLT